MDASGNMQTTKKESGSALKIWTDAEEMNVGNTVDELRRAMLFKASHIKAKADPNCFSLSQISWRSLRICATE